jgi:hypothetical protein
MCKHGDEVVLRVPINPELSFDGQSRWDDKGIDRCIAPLVQALNFAGIYTSSCCCGHNAEYGHIWLQDGRVLIILPFGTKTIITEYVRKN